MEQDQLAQNITIALEKISQAQRNFLWEIAKKEGISPIQIQFIDYLNKTQYSLCTVSHLAREFDLTKATVSESIRVLVKKELLQKISDKTDKRKFYLTLTDKMRQRIIEIEEKSNILLNIIKKFPEEQKEEISVFLMDLIKQLYENGYIQTARICLTCRNFIRDARQDSPQPHYCRFAKINLSNQQLSFNCQEYAKKV